MKNVFVAILGIVGLSSLICLHNKHKEKVKAEHLQILIHTQMDESKL
jgi:hypothetical protein